MIKPCRISYDWNAFSEYHPDPPSRFLESEPGIESDSPEVVALAKKIQGSPLEIIQNAFFLVHNSLKYKLQKKEYGARHAARTGIGDCTEYASLFAAILRVHKIGARINAGFLEGNQLHAITEVFLNGIWIPMDITNDSQPFLGIYRDFITLMRANWMLSRGMEKIVSFYYRSSHKVPPLLHSKTEVKKIIPKLPLVHREEVASNLSFSIHPQKDFWDIQLTNLTPLKISASLILQSSNRILKVWPFILHPEEKIVFPLPYMLLKSYFSQYATLKLFVKQSEKIYLLTSLNQEKACFFPESCYSR